MKQALLAGINNYPGTGNDLQGCLNDVADWNSLLTQLGFETSIFKDSAVTKANIKNSLRAMIAASQPGDVLLFQYSGHGTSVMDYSGDEGDSYDEALYLYDGVLLDDDLRAIFKVIPEGVQMIVILDSCFSGTATRVITDENAKRRYLQFDPIRPEMKKRKKFLVAEDMREILISGCGEEEYCYDALINGRYNGAFTRNAIDTIEQGMTYGGFMDALNEKLPSQQYPQTPQLECSACNASRELFSSAVDTGVDDPNEPEQPAEPPAPAKPTWWKRNWKKVVWGIVIAVLIILSIKYF